MNIPQVVSFADTATAFSYKSTPALRRSFWVFNMINNPVVNKLGTALLQLAIKLRLPVKYLIKKTAFEQFCGGETIEDCAPTINKLYEYGVGTILDYSVEGEKTTAGFENVVNELLHNIDAARLHPGIPFAVFKVTGICSFDLLAKKQSGAALSAAETQAFEAARARFQKICQRAYDNGVPVFIDGEESWIQDTIDALTYEMMALYNKEQAIVYNTYQMYRHDMLNNLRQAHQHAKAQGYVLGAKLVRGAYMEKERAYAAAANMPDPINPDKAATDKLYDQGLAYCVENRSHIYCCSGSHNEASNYLLVELMQRQGLMPNDPHFWFAQLYGMSDNISFNLSKEGYNVAKYVPYGPVRAVMPYLVRRAKENSSVAGQSSREFLLVKKELERRRKQPKQPDVVAEAAA